MSAIKTIKKRIFCCVFWVVPLLMLSGCKGTERGSEIRDISAENGELVYSHSMDLKYAKEFSVDYYEGGYALISVAESDHFLLIPPNGTVPENIAEDIVILRQPIENIYLAASAVMDMFVSMDGLGQVRFSSLKEEGWYIEEARKAMEKGNILYAGKYGAPDYERIISEGCGLAIENTMIYHSPQVKEQMGRFGIPVLVDYSSYEKNPLGRTEWIRLYGLLTGREKEAEEAFSEQAGVYEAVRSRAEKEERTVAFFYITSNGGVNIRRASDYLPRMIELAGGSYVFPDTGEESRSSTMVIQMEEFYARAKDADYLIYNSTVDEELTSLEDLLAKNSLLRDFKAVQNGNVFCTAKNLYQSSMALGTIISDIHEMIKGGEENLTYLYRLK